MELFAINFFCYKGNFYQNVAYRMKVREKKILFALEKGYAIPSLLTLQLFVVSTSVA